MIHLLPNFETFGSSNAEDIFSIESSDGDNFNSSTGSLTSSAGKDLRDQNNNEFSSGIKASWQLGNLIYDPEINDINNSARIVSNIRENLLTELTQIYFARRELQYKILSSIFGNESPIRESSSNKGFEANTGATLSESPETTKETSNISADGKLLAKKAKAITLKIEKFATKLKEPENNETLKDKLKLAEYTAQIDARTGSWFTNELNKRYKEGTYEKYFGT